MVWHQTTINVTAPHLLTDIEIGTTEAFGNILAHQFTTQIQLGFKQGKAENLSSKVRNVFNNILDMSNYLPDDKLVVYREMVFCIQLVVFCSHPVDASMCSSKFIIILF
jgi:hypothetical protein